MKKDLRGTWRQAIITFVTPLVLIAVFRWLIFEPFVIPSGSMIPTLLVHDHIFVNKLAYGVRYPFSKQYMIRWNQPKVGDIIVFRFPNDPDVYYVKRVQAIAGDRLKMAAGDIVLNDQVIERTPAVPYEDLNDSDNRFSYFQERDYTVRYLQPFDTEFPEMTVPEKALFGMGDNRDQSNDSRYWGTIPLDYVIGKPFMIWLSCDKPFPGTEMLCDPQSVRFNRIGKLLQ